jgi:hypothetical protein
MRPRSFSFIVDTDDDTWIRGMTFMNHLVFLDSNARELEKILSGFKTMIVKETNSSQPKTYPINPGDSLYFLRETDKCDLRVKATVVRVLLLKNEIDETLSHALKEMQPGLQFTEGQYNNWAGKAQILLIEIEGATKIPAIRIDPNKVTDRSNWIAFDTFNLLLDEELLMKSESSL